MKEETQILIKRMNCNGCVKNITHVLQVLPGVEVGTIDLPTKTVHLRYNAEQTTMETIKVRLAEANYPVVDEPLTTSEQQEEVSAIQDGIGIAQ